MMIEPVPMSDPNPSSPATPNPQRQFLVDELALVTEARSQAVFRWLSLGWTDFRACWRVSAVYAALFVAGGLLISFGFYFMGLPYLILPSLSGFLLVGPALAVGFYEISRRRAADMPISLGDAFKGFTRNALGIFGLGIFLVFLFQVWIRTSFTIAGLSFRGVPPEWPAIIERAFTTIDGLYFGIGIMALGSVFATIVFFIGAFSIPLMVDRKTVLVPSLLVSAFAVWRNKSTMLLWALMIVLFMGMGLFTAFLGMVIAFPLIGHATWHAYREVLSGTMPSEQTKPSQDRPFYP